MWNPRLTGLALTIAGCALALGLGRGACADEPSLPAPPRLQSALTRLAAEARPGTLGITVSDLRSGRTWRVNADRPYPLMSVFKAPLGATVLSEVDRGKLSLERIVVVRRQDLMTRESARSQPTFTAITRYSRCGNCSPRQ
jgi:beta-lactamase class A